MSLPTLHVPTDDVKLFSLAKPVKVRPYLVGEEKVMLMAQQALEQDPKTKEVEKAIRQVIHNCTFGAVSTDTLPVFDVSYLFLKLRAMSLNNIIESQFRCKNDVHKTDTTGATHLETEKCDTLVPVSIDIADIKIVVPPGHTNKVWLSEDLGVQLKYPTANIYDAAQTAVDMSDIIKGCLDKVFNRDGSEVWELTQETDADVQAFVDALSLKNVADIREQFFDTMPALNYTFTFTCPKCSYSEFVTLRELEDFFD